MPQNRPELIKRLIGVASNVIAHNIILKAELEKNIRDYYAKEIEGDIDISLDYRNRINPADEALPPEDAEEIRNKILSKVRAELLKRIPYNNNSDDYGFHTDIVLQSRYAGARFREIGIPTRYEEISTSISVYKSIIYGFRTMQMVVKYLLHKFKLIKFREFMIRK